MHPYRTHTCNELNTTNEGQQVRLSGWIYRVRDLGGITFIDLRDHYGITQIVINNDKEFHKDAQNWKLESVLTITGTVVKRNEDTINDKIPTGKIELIAEDLIVQNWVNHMPFLIDGENEMPEHIRLKYRYLDLRQKRLHKNIMLRSQIISSLRRRMTDHTFQEFQTPILTCSSPEGARDFLVPSRLHPGKFYALPQAPQQFKQLLMVSSFDRYFQIAPCFRDEDARADRSPGEFYQLDIEMSFATQDDLFAIVEDVLIGVFEEFTSWKSPEKNFIRISYEDSMLKYGSDKPDLRNPLEIQDVSQVFANSNFKAFSACLENNGVVRCIFVKDVHSKARSFHDKMNEYAQEQGAKGLAYLLFNDGEIKSPIAKFLSEEELQSLTEITNGQNGALYFIADDKKKAEKLAGNVRTELANRLELINHNDFVFCWIVDFPMYELNEETNEIEFSHNPFSMPQGEMEALEKMNPLDIKAYQYDLVCNGVELSSGAIRNHKPEIMYKAFEIASYSKEDVEREFSGMLNAFKHGAPPHGGIAPGVDRMVMLILQEPNIREIIAFPFNQQAMDLMMNAPSEVSQKQLDELHLKLNLPKAKK